MFLRSLQLKIKRIHKSQEGEYEPSDYMPVSKHDRNEMYHELVSYIESINNSYLQQLLKSFL